MRRHRTGFSLIEVVIAIAIVAGGVAVILALLPALMRNSENAANTQTALRLPDAVHAELMRAMGGDFDSFAGHLASTGFALVAEQDGSNIRPRDGADHPLRSRYFLIEVRTFATGELAYTPGDAVVFLQATVSWPYRGMAAGILSPPTTAADRQLVSFNLALNP